MNVNNNNNNLAIIVLVMLVVSLYGYPKVFAVTDSLSTSYNKGLIMGRQDGRYGIEDSAPGAICPSANYNETSQLCSMM